MGPPRAVIVRAGIAGLTTGCSPRRPVRPSTTRGAACSVCRGIGRRASGSTAAPGWAGGYVGTGVTATNLAGRTLADLVLERDCGRSRLLWVGHRARRWEPEPLRWLGVHSLYLAYRAADRRESAWPGSPTASLAVDHSSNPRPWRPT